MQLEQIINLTSKVGLATLLILVIIGGSQGYWVYGSTYKDMVADRDVWKELALKATQVAERTTVKLGVPPLPPLARASSPADVEDRLATLNSRVKYMTEPAEETQK
jgi:hypothetical protein